MPRAALLSGALIGRLYKAEKFGAVPQASHYVGRAARSREGDGRTSGCGSLYSLRPQRQRVR
jgi:hypothetical protein